MRASRGLKWENKMYKLKRSIMQGNAATRQQSSLLHFRNFLKLHLQCRLNLTLQFH